MKGITYSVAPCTMYVELRRRLYLSTGTEKNIKITTTDDVELFEVLVETEIDK